MTRSASFVHVIATRLGIGVYDENWFDYRFQLFESIALPSIAAQTSREFTWLLVVGRDMPPLARKRLDKAVDGLDNALVMPVEFKTDLKEAIVTYARQRATEAGAGHVLTSRLDDDDALRTNALERLHGEAADYLRTSRQRYAVFSFTVGCMWSPTHRVGFTRYHYSHSIGTSIMEPAEECQSVHAWRHLKIKYDNAPRGSYVGDIGGDTRWWLYTTHQLADSETGDRVRINRILKHRHRYRVDDALLGEFGIDPDRIDALASIGNPETTQPTKFLSLRGHQSEREIRRVRTQLRRTSRLRVWRKLTLRWRLRRLDQERRRAGSGIIRTVPGG